MPIHFLDASAWVKRSVAEEGSQRVNAWMNRNPLVTSAALGVTEVLSTIIWKARAGEFSEAERDRDRIVDHVWAEFDAFAHVCHTAPVTRHTQDAALRFGLRGADAVHRASALWLEAHPPPNVASVAMIVSDRERAEAADQVGLDVCDPMREPLPAP